MKTRRFQLAISIWFAAWGAAAMARPAAGAAVPGQVAPREFNATLVAHMTYEYRATRSSKDESGTDTATTTHTFSATSNVQVVCRTDEWGVLSIQLIDGKKPIVQGTATKIESEDIRFKDGSYDRQWSTATGSLDDPDDFRQGVCNISNNDGNHKEMTISPLGSVHIKGTAHSRVHTAKPEGTPDVVGEVPIDATWGPGGFMAPASQIPKDYKAGYSSNWYGATTRALPNGYSVNFSGSRESKGNAGEKISETMHASVDLMETKPVAVDMQIAPVDAAAYAQYLPMPVSDDPAVIKLFGTNQPIAFTATLAPKDPKIAPPVGVIDFYLEGLSHHKGICGNYPPNGSEKPGLEFVPAPGIQVDGRDPTHAYTTSAVGSATIEIKANETGAYGNLRAACHDLAVEAAYKPTGDFFIRIPQDDDQNHVADAWEKSPDIKIFDKKYPATWDEEATPKGKNTGDGLTLYEEYRGFVAADGKNNRIFLRLSPNNKKLFVYPTGNDADLYRTGIGKYASVSGIAIFLIDDKKELQSDNPDPDDASWLNFNSSTSDGIDFGPKEHAVVIRPRTIAQENADSGTWGQTDPITQPNEGPYTPNDVLHVAVMHDEIRRMITEQLHAYVKLEAPSHDLDWLTNHGLSPADMAAIEGDPNKLNALVEEGISYTVLHELGHATGAEHHGLDQLRADEAKKAVPKGKTANDYYATGDSTCPMFYWFNGDNKLLFPFMLGKWNPADTAWIRATKDADFGAPTPWVFCPDDRGKLALH